ncbi:MAG: 50S ribosomal protein L29 [Chitinophagales bacterium]|nr:50S ribosomal protein L29 [Bacteroidota bacterium]MBX7139941.1 50S ribosomal protein L29 [Chitinophagales bacterium]
MAKKKIHLNDLTDAELNEKLRDDKAQFVRMKFNHAVSPIENPTRLRQLRRDIARIKTEITRRANATKTTNQ